MLSSSCSSSFQDLCFSSDVVIELDATSDVVWEFSCQLPHVTASISAEIAATVRIWLDEVAGVSP